MNKIIFATGNADKMKEIREILSDTGLEIVSMKEAGLECHAEENGATFEENARIKATAVAAEAGKNAVVLADDSGLEIDALNKEPGVHSARYMGENTSYDIKNREILRRMENIEDEKRTARFVCAICAVFPDGEIHTVRGTIEGRIGHEPKGENGFGYDPIFYVPEYGCSTAEMTSGQKNEISHRGKALREIRKIFMNKRI